MAKPSFISEKTKHLSSILVSKGYPSSFVQKLTRTGKAAPRTEPATKFLSPSRFCGTGHFKGEPEPLSRWLQQQCIHANPTRHLGHI